MSAVARTRPPGQDPSGSRAAPARYEMRIRTVVSKVLVASFPVRSTRAAVGRQSQYRLWIEGDRDIAEVVGRLEEHGVEVLDIRMRALPT